MRVSVATVAEFFERVGPAYVALVKEPLDELAALEIDLAPGEYRAANLSVGDPLDRRAIDIVIRGADAARPPVLTDMSLRLTGDRVGRLVGQPGQCGRLPRHGHRHHQLSR